MVVNALPIIGVLFFEWDAFLIVVTYWAENLVIGFYMLLKIACVKVEHPAEHIGKLFLIPFFAIHYGGFTAIHGSFVLSIFGQDKQFSSMKETWPCFLVFLQMLVNLIKAMYSIIPPNARLFLLALFISHGVSFLYNYLYKREYASSNPNNLMFQPYLRVVLMHIIVLAGGGLAMAFGSPKAMLIPLVILKTVTDVFFHLCEHGRLQSSK